MKTVVTSLSMIIVFIMTSQAQQESYSKNNNIQSKQESIVYEPVPDQVYISDMIDGSGGYTDCFYYGDPSGMFLNVEWEKGTALLVDGNLLQGSFRYNLYNQKMEAIIEADTFAIAKPCELEFLMIGKKKFSYSTFIRDDHEVANAWFEILCEGNCTLLIRRYIKYRVSDGDEDVSNDKLYRLEEYYTRRGEGPPERLYASKKLILESLQNHETEVCEYIKSEKLKLQEQAELIRLFAYYNSLD